MADYYYICVIKLNGMYMKSDFPSVDFINQENITKEVQIDEEQKIKISTVVNKDPISSFIFLYEPGICGLLNLSKAGLKIFKYIATNIKVDENFITFKQVDVAKQLFMTNAEISNGIKDLIRNWFIHKSKDKPFTYIINHNFFFKGDRRKYIIYRRTKNGD